MNNTNHGQNICKIFRERTNGPCGMSVIHNGRIICISAIGASINSRFRLASVTKLFTALCILQLHEKGSLYIGEEISKYTEWVTGTNAYRLMNHTSGLDDNVFKIDEVMVLDSSINHGVSYSSCGYHLLGGIIQNVSGLVYENYLSENIFKPLGMVDSGVVINGYDYEVDEKFVKGNYADYIDVPYITSSAMYSSINDMSIFLEALWTGKIIGNVSLLFHIQSKYNKVANHSPEGSINYRGGTSGFNSIVLIDLKRNLVITVLAAGVNVDDIANNIWDYYKGGGDNNGKTI